MKIAFCDNSLKELLNFRGDIIRHYAQFRHDVILLAPKNFSGKIPDGCEFYETQIDRGGMNPIKDLLYFFSIKRLYNKLHPDIVFHYTIKPNIYGSIAAKLCKIRSIAVVTGLGYAFNHSDLKSRIARKLYKIGLSCASHVIVLNQNNLKKLVSLKIVSPDKIILLPGGEGVNLSEFSI